ncbi:NAD(P)/FAD-dependent oxidoreductase [Streptomyces sp. WMMB303]|uniref:NAD(P)/FAD-dependent oxidoreductase n=1 Tax=Streptomyces sp. WMMB303 TaxID=3034154 RepID=UPI0023EDBAC6|nr:NAD(P)/FAD-dependent oxidoreductase [Streptomyces sp. WMMB303]MDF4249142.1 NAD(P)/FAD-dependent oxidoreductase [Streptomyces sp. WMMB303]
MDAATAAGRTWDAVVIGGGAAGVAAGTVLARARFATLVVDGGAPRNGPADHMHGYPTWDGMAPREFVAIGQSEFGRYGGTLLRASVAGARRAPDGTFGLRLGDGHAVRTRSVLVATGLTDELPGIPGLSERWASQVHHCPHCHGYEVRGRSLAVLGSPMGAVSIHLAALLRRYSPTVTFCVNGVEVGAAERQRLTAYGVRLVDGRVTRVGAPAGTGEGDAVAIELESGESLVCEAVFVAPRPAPHDAILVTLGAARDPVSGLVVDDGQGATDVPGVWAAGNVVTPRAQVVAAAGAGSTAAVSMSAWLLERELSAAVRGEQSAPGGAL